MANFGLNLRVEPTEGLFDLVDHSTNIGIDGNVTLNVQNARPQFFSLGSRFGRFGVIYGEDTYAGLHFKRLQD